MFHYLKPIIFSIFLFIHRLKSVLHLFFCLLIKNLKMSHFTVLTVKAESEFSEILKAELSQIGFDIFLDIDDQSFETSIESDIYSETEVQEIFSRYESVENIGFDKKIVEKQNWNELWERNYDPIIVQNKIFIHADFHKIEGNFEHRILINPKMSFGTGHHQTTALMLEFELETEIKDKRVVDLGCGTGILGILAKKMKADLVNACDIEEWAIENSRENAALNQMKFYIEQGTVELFIYQTDFYDVVLANIQLNVLLDEMEIYAKILKTNGILLISGFYEKDSLTLQDHAKKFGLIFESQKLKNDWCALRFKFKPFEKWAFQEVEETFGISRVQKLPLLESWLNNTEEITEKDREKIVPLQERLSIFSDAWAESRSYRQIWEYRNVAWASRITGRKWRSVPNYALFFSE
ncbi:MAG: 50S ribosomal protein L11 methyltransferase [Bacteroidetes bacterium]|nr:MAG: 50S ribosomal protein L11 methyltransferase [Bacteroidota bacterium]